MASRPLQNSSSEQVVNPDAQKTQVPAQEGLQPRKIGVGLHQNSSSEQVVNPDVQKTQVPAQEWLPQPPKIGGETPRKRRSGCDSMEARLARRKALRHGGARLCAGDTGYQIPIGQVLDHFDLRRFSRDFFEATIRNLEDFADVEDTDLEKMGLPMDARRKLVEAVGEEGGTGSHPGGLSPPPAGSIPAQLEQCARRRKGAVHRGTGITEADPSLREVLEDFCGQYGTWLP